MATIKYIILEHHKKSDGKYNIKFRLTHNRKTRYISSSLFAVDKQLNKDLTIKDTKLLLKANSHVETYWDRIQDIGTSISYMDVDDVLKVITSETIVEDVDFVKFCEKYLEGLKEKGKTGTLRAMRPAYNYLKDYVESIDANDVDSLFLKAFDSYLRTEKKITRHNGEGRTEHTINSALNDAGVFKVMQNLRSFHNHCKSEYNSERNEVITSNPFKYYKMPKYSPARKDMDSEIIEKIRSYRDADLTGRKELSRDIFMLSFYLCGMNAKDMYDGKYIITSSGRIEYERAKTSERRSDNAFISIKIPKEAIPLLKKYSPTYLQKRYNTHEGFTSALSGGAKGSGFTFYGARDSFASIAANICGFNTNMIEVALNHYDRSRVINNYVARDWTVIDRVQKGVLKTIK